MTVNGSDGLVGVVTSFSGVGSLLGVVMVVAIVVGMLGVGTVTRGLTGINIIILSHLVAGSCVLHNYSVQT